MHHENVNSARIISAVLISVLILSLITVPVRGDTEFDGTWVIEKGMTVQRVNEEIILNDDLIVRGTLYLKNVELYLNTSAGSEIIVEEGGTFRVEESVIKPLYKKYHTNLTLELNRGENLISFPFYSSSESVRDVLSPLDGYYDMLWYYDPLYDYKWRTYKPDREPFYNDLNKINNTMGVMANITQNTTLNLDGFLPKNHKVNLKQGANMVAYQGDEKRNVSEVFSDVQDNLVSISTVKSGEEIYLDDNDTLEPGRGYWVEVDNDCTWTYINEDGLEGSRALNSDLEGNTRILYEEDSSGSIEYSELSYLGGSDTNSGLVIESDSVSISSTTFRADHIGVSISSSNPMITSSTFIDCKEVGLKSCNSSFKLNDNIFKNTGGHALEVNGGTPDIEGNHLRETGGVRLTDTEAVFFDNNISYSSGVAVNIHRGNPLFENNIFVKNEESVAVSVDSKVKILDNLFYKNGGGISTDGGNPTIQENLFINNGYAIRSERGSLDIIGNEVKRTIGWGFDLIDSVNSTVSGNELDNCSFGIKVSGLRPVLKNNTVSNCGGTGVRVYETADLRFTRNEITNNSGTGFLVRSSTGVVLSNNFINNYAGVELVSTIDFINNTISNNELYGIFVSGGKPYLEQNILSNNQNQGIRFSGSSVVVRTTSILNSHYSLYLSNSDVMMVNSIFKKDLVFIDENSNLTVQDGLTVTIDEDTNLRGYDIYSYLPPSAEITNVTGNGSVSVTINPQGLDFEPEDDFFGTVNMTLNVTISEIWNTTVPLSVSVTPLNDPPILRNKSVRVSYEPTNVRWVIVYEDKDDVPPDFIELVIDGDHYDMKPDNTSDSTISDGKRYYYEIYLEPGKYEYYIIARENNTLGKETTKKTTPTQLEIDPPKPQWLGMSNLEIAVCGFVFLAVILVLVYIYYFRERYKLRKISEQLQGKSEPVVRELPILKKRNEEEGQEKKTDEEEPDKTAKEKPLLKKKKDVEGRSKLRVIKEEETSEEESKTGEEEGKEGQIIETVGEIEETGPEEDEPEKRKHRVIKKEKRKKILQRRKRVLKDEEKDYDKENKKGSGKRKRVLKKDN